MNKDLKNCKNLDELLDLLINHNDVDENSGWSKYERDMTSLPNFGGDEPNDTEDIWSWDADRLLVSGASEFEIVNRADYLN